MHRVPPPPPPSESPPVEGEEGEDIAEAIPEEGEHPVPSEEEESIEAAMDEEEDDGDSDEPGMWEETFKTHHDSKPYGMTS